jgi:predicted nucleic acid-binding Zn ribbon protein
MKKNNTQPIGEVLREYVEALKLNQKIKEVRAIGMWEELLGKSIASRTKRIYIKDKVLYVFLTSAVVRNELFLIRESIIQKINEHAGEKVVEKMVLR